MGGRRSAERLLVKSVVQGGGQRGLQGLLGCREEMGVNRTRSLLTGEPCASSP